jgi:hypothetical protein
MTKELFSFSLSPAIIFKPQLRIKCENDDHEAKMDLLHSFTFPISHTRFDIISWLSIKIN